MLSNSSDSGSPLISRMSLGSSTSASKQVSNRLGSLVLWLRSNFNFRFLVHRDEACLRSCLPFGCVRHLTFSFQGKSNSSFLSNFALFRPRWFFYAAIRAEIFHNPAAEDLLFQANLQPGHERALSVQSNSAFHAKNPPYSILKIFRHFRVCLRSPSTTLVLLCRNSSWNFS